MLSRIRFFILVLLSLGLCIHPTSSAPDSRLPFPPGTSLAEARKGFVTKLVRKEHGSDAPDKPPADLFQLVQYHSPAGKLAAYLSVPPKDSAKHPAIIWITGGFGNDIGDTAWAPAKPENDQSASAFRKAGLVMMYPSLRGGNTNPGFRECCFGEVNDVLSAADFLARQDFVDRARIYLGGHSTGGTLVLLCAESSSRFRAVLSFGPVAGVASYGRTNLPFDMTDKMELYLRSPILFLDSIQSPVLVIEGDSPPGNISALRTMAQVSANPKISFHPVPGLNHFSELAPATKLLADKLMHDTGPTANVQVTDAELAALGPAGK